MPLEPVKDLRLVLAAALTVRTAWLQPFEDGFRVFQRGPWAGRQLAVLWHSTTALDRLRVADTPSGRLTMLRVMGDGGVDVHLVLGEQDESGEVLTAAIDALSGLFPWTTAGPA